MNKKKRAPKINDSKWIEKHFIVAPQSDNNYVTRWTFLLRWKFHRKCHKFVQLTPRNRIENRDERRRDTCWSVAEIKSYLLRAICTNFLLKCTNSASKQKEHLRRRQHTHKFQIEVLFDSTGSGPNRILFSFLFSLADRISRCVFFNEHFFFGVHSLRISDFHNFVDR